MKMNTSKTDAKGQALTRNRILTSVTLVFYTCIDNNWFETTYFYWVCMHLTCLFKSCLYPDV